MKILEWINGIIAVVFMLSYAYQFFYLFVVLRYKEKPLPEARKLHRYAVVVAARNEENVIGNLLDSVKRQDYPAELVDMFVVADNCTDATAQIAREHGAVVWERHSKENVGKGYALDFLFGKIEETYAERQYDGYLVFDADNLLDEGYISAMNRSFDAGNRVIASYRNSKNYGDNWISAGYALWFLRESRFMNGARNILGTNCVITGTGFLIHGDIVRQRGWKYYLLTEDAEFTADCLLRDEKVAYCGEAVFYDEQPVEFLQSWRQRMRWAKGYLQVFRKFGARLIKGMFCTGDFSYADLSLSIMPAAVLSLSSILVNAVSLAVSLFFGWEAVLETLRPMLVALGNSYLLLLFIAVVTTLSEWKKIRCGAVKKLAYMFTLPIFMLSYIPVSMAALFAKVEWKPIYHGAGKSLEMNK